MKKLAIIGTVGLPANYGGFETLVHYLTPFLVEEYNTTVFCSTKGYPKNKRLKTHKGAKLIFLPLSANGLSSIIYDVLSMLLAIRKNHILLVLGVSGAFFFPIIKIFTNRKIIVNIDGIEWKRNKWSKMAKLFLKASEKIAVKYADTVICDNQAVLDYVECEHKIKGKLIAYGGDHAHKIPLTKELINQYSFLSKKYAFKVARIEPENNIHLILEAFQKIDLNIVIIGNWNNSEYGEKLKQKYQDNKRVHLLNPIYDLSILDQFRGNCSIYVHGHSAGGTNPSLVEAMNLGLPIVTYDVNFNRETTKNKALYFKTTIELQQSLTKITQEEKIVIGNELKIIGKEFYSWEVIAQSYINLLQEVTSNRIL